MPVRWAFAAGGILQRCVPLASHSKGTSVSFGTEFSIKTVHWTAAGSDRAVSPDRTVYLSTELQYQAVSISPLLQPDTNQYCAGL